MSDAACILVIKLSALGDFIQAFPAFDRIRAAHRRAHITLLTTPPYAALAAAGPWFDVVEDNGRPGRVTGSLALIRRVRRRRYDTVYDLQGNDRTNALFQALGPFPPRWSGVAFGCALPHRNPDRMRMHTLERQAEQLRDAGLWPDAPTAPGSAPPPDVSWMISPRDEPTMVGAPLAGAAPLALLVPGAAPRRTAKRWPAEFYADLARRLRDHGFHVLLIGGPPEMALAAEIEAAAPGVVNMAGRTDFHSLAALGARAALAVGNDTGPMHLIAAAGAPSVCLFSADSDPELCAPRGAVTVLREARLADLSVDAVIGAAMTTMANHGR